MEKVVMLQIFTADSMIGIPFLDLEALDLFTVRYQNKKELIDALNKILNLSLKHVFNVNVYVEYVSRKNLYKRNDLEVKYREDNFDKMHLGESFADYLKKDHNRVRNCGVYDINTKAMFEFKVGENDLSDFDIELAVKKYLTNAPYRTFRKVYYMIKDYVRVRKNVFVRSDLNRQKDLSEYNTDDDFISSLISYASRGEEECAKAMDELSRIDLEELRNKISHSNYSLFDGNAEDNVEFYQDLYDFEQCTGISVKEMSDYISVKKIQGYRR